MVTTGTIHPAWDILYDIMDPEVPVLSITDLGIVRSVEEKLDTVSGASQLHVTITPTYTGCPAMEVITQLIRMELTAAGYTDVRVHSVLSPAWTTDWMTQAGKEKLLKYGIAPPHAKAIVCEPALFAAEEAIQCPHCQSFHTHRISEFGSTACKSLYKCDQCLEPFDYFKCH